MVYGCLWVAFFLFLLPDLLGVCRVHEVSGGLEGFIGAELYGLLGTIMHDPLWAVDWGLPRNAGLTTMSMIISTLAKSLNQWIYIYGIQFLETCIARCLVGQRVNEGAGPHWGSSFLVSTWGPGHALLHGDLCGSVRGPEAPLSGSLGSKRVGKDGISGSRCLYEVHCCSLWYFDCSENVLVPS